ncbi:ribonuclease T2-like protein [Syncephalis fuscata]|nr:ribonuclease T2-like protein [Syncephalis fuscata]
MKQLSQASFVLFALPIQIYNRLSSLLLFLLLLSGLSLSLVDAFILIGNINDIPVSYLRHENNCPEIYSCSANATTTDLCCVPKYGLLQLVLQWDTTLGPANNFTIHGFHPTGCNGELPPKDGCDSERQYKSAGAKIQSNNPYRYDSMITYWPSKKGYNSGLWTHEWKKYGTCISTLSPKCYGRFYKDNIDMTYYFEQAIVFHNIYSPSNAFIAAGIKPGDRRNIDEFINAFRKDVRFKGGISLQCDNDKIIGTTLYFAISGDIFTLRNPPQL